MFTLSIWRIAVLALVACGLAAPQVTLAQSANDELTTVELVEQVLPGVVAILAVPEDGNGGSIGSGFVYDDQGHIITNHHVVVGMDQFYVTYTNGTYIEAELIGLDGRDDIAVLKVDPDTLPLVLPMADSDEVAPGEKVVAIGSPSGVTNTITEGVASGSGRTPGDLGLYFQNQCSNYNNLIQHSADINGGNSGGPLFNMNGEVIGINTIQLIGRDGDPMDGVFFAVPSNTIEKRAQDLIEDGELSLPYMGVDTIPLTVTEAVINDLPVAYGAFVEEVANNSPADDAGIEENTIILSIDDRDITPEDTLTEILFNYDPGDTIEVVYIDANGEHTTDLTLAEVPQSVLEDCNVPEE